MSLTSSGVCVKVDGKVEVLTSIKTKSTDLHWSKTKVPRPPKFSCDLERYIHITREVMKLMPENVDLVVVEDFYIPQSKMQIGSAMKLVGLGHLIRCEMWEKGIPFVVVSPSQLKKFVSGKGTCPKDQVCKHVYKNWGIDPTNDDEGDATVGAYTAEAIGNYLRDKTSVDSLHKYQKDVIIKMTEERPFYNRDKFK